MAKRTRTPKAKVIAVPSTDDAPAPVNYPAPIPLDAVLGQDRAVAALDAAMGSGRLHHAWIFHGPKGVGKFTAALAFAAALLDPTSSPDSTGRVRPDPESDVQHLLAARVHPDMHVIVKELARFHDERSVREKKLATIPVDVIREHLLAPAVLAPKQREHGPAGKVFIIDEAELLDRSAAQASSQNAMLKVMEEPPEGTVIILVTSSEDRLLPTIRSRCQRVGFSPLHGAAFDRWITDQSQPDAPHADAIDRLNALSPDRRVWAISAAAGSPGRLVELLTTGLVEMFAELEPSLEQLERGGFPPTLASMIHDRTDKWAEAWVKRNTNASVDAAKRTAMHELFTLLAHRYQPRPEHGPRHAAVAASRIEAIGAAQRDLQTNVNKLFVCHGLVAGLADASSGTPVLA